MECVANEKIEPWSEDDWKDWCQHGQWNEDDYDDDWGDWAKSDWDDWDESPCEDCSRSENCDGWDATFCCTLCKYEGRDDCENCNPMDL